MVNFNNAIFKEEKSVSVKEHNDGIQQSENILPCGYFYPDY